nr:uncharacterized protein LOC111996366 [Quercus suber]
MGGTATTSSSKKARKTYLRMVQNIQLTGVIPKLPRIDIPIIDFSEEDVQRLHHPHDDALVVSIQIGDYNTHRVLVDNGSLANILYKLAFQQMWINKERLVPTNAPLVGFGRTKQITRDVTFLVVDCSSAYNAIIGQPTLNSWKAITSTYHLMIKFPTKYGVGELLGDQITTREYYIAMLEMADHLQTMSIEEQRTRAEPVERLEEIPLDSSRLNRTTRIGTLARPTVRLALVAFLKENQDVFAWSHEDMPRINPLVMVHRLNVSPAFPPVRQKKRVLA